LKPRTCLAPCSTRQARQGTPEGCRSGLHLRPL
jgi:hypothetical protein